jgi:hypothetical protein
MQIELTESNKNTGREQLFRKMFAMLSATQRKSMARELQLERDTFIGHVAESVWLPVKQAKIEVWNNLCEA